MSVATGSIMSFVLKFLVFRIELKLLSNAIYDRFSVSFTTTLLSALISCPSVNQLINTFKVSGQTK